MEIVGDIRALTSWLIDTSLGFCLLTLSVLLFIFCYLYFFKKANQKNLRLANRFYILVSEVSLCESDEEREQVLLQPYVQDMQQTSLRKRRRRAFMRKTLVQFHKTIHGTAADNSKWLYEKLGFKNDSLQQLASRHWHKKAAAIQDLAAMGQQDCITSIYRYTNHSNYYIRSAAQIGVVKLTGFEGLRFLNVVSQPITQWQQICLLQQLASDTNIQEEKLKAWLVSDNDTVVELALKLVKAYAVHGVHDQLVHCLQHPAITIRIEAIQVLKEVATATTVSVLKAHYAGAEQMEKMAILEGLQLMGTGDDAAFLVSQLDTPDQLLKTEIKKTLKILAPDWEINSAPHSSTAPKLIPAI